MTALTSAIAISAGRLWAEPDSLPSPIADSDTTRAEHYACRFGRTYDSYLAVEPGWERFWSTGVRGVVALARSGRHLFCCGGLLAPAEHRGELLRQCVDRYAGLRNTLTFLNICEEQLPLFHDAGFQATKWGEEAIVDLPGCDWSGRNYEWVRRQTNYCRRQGLESFEFRREGECPDFCGVPAQRGDKNQTVHFTAGEEISPRQWALLAAELSHVSRLFLAAKPQAGEMRFLQAAFDPWRPGRKRFFVARRQPAGRIEGFLVCTPCDGSRTWVMETCRQRPDAVRGTLAFLMHQAMRQLQAEGVLRVSLCLLPGLRCSRPLPGDSPLVRWGLRLGTGSLSPAYATVGSYHFKSRFRPRFENRYVCALPRVTCSTAVAFIRLSGALQFNPGRLIGLMWDRWRKRAARATLTAPEAG